MTRLTARKCQKAAKREKAAVLNTFISQTGYERKYAVRLLANEGKAQPKHKTARLAAARASGSRRACEKIYGGEALGALAAARDAFSCQCGKLPAPFPRANIGSIALHPRFAFSDAARLKLKKTSAAAIDRLLPKEKAKRRVKGTSGTKAAGGISSPLFPP